MADNPDSTKEGVSIFSDKRFDQLDWMTQITETIDSELNTMLARLPDRIELEPNHLMKYVNGYGQNIHLGVIVIEKIRQLNPDLPYQDQNKLVSCYKFEIKDGPLEIDLVTRTVKGSVAVVKIKSAIEDEELLKTMGDEGIQAIHNVTWADEVPLSRADEILDLLGKCEVAMKRRSMHIKTANITRRLKEIFSTNEWRIRDMELANKIGRWIALYLSKGNLPALTNICKVKVMTHNNMPIYSIEEEK